METIAIRELSTEDEWRQAFPVLRQLRPHLDEATYLASVREMREQGYTLFGLFCGKELAAVTGVIRLTNLYYGRHVWVYDLVCVGLRPGDAGGPAIPRVRGGAAAPHPRVGEAVRLWGCRVVFRPPAYAGQPVLRGEDGIRKDQLRVQEDALTWRRSATFRFPLTCAGVRDGRVQGACCARKGLRFGRE